ncbi:hypothetical protein ACF0H5_022081 [Mactra antiquata]
MASRPPALPVRQRSQTGTTHVSYKDVNKSERPEHRTQHNVRTNNNVTYVPLGHSSSNRQTKYKYSVEPTVGGASQEPPPPPRPPKPHEDVPNHPIRGRSIETASFVQRNTARIFSDPDHVSPPTVETNRRRTVPNPHQSPDGDLPPPPPPVSRPPRGPPKQLVVDFESRFRFHEPSDFPEPESQANINRKEYPSASFRRKQQQQHHSRRTVTIDAL